jgi:hypothetical protein
MPATRPAECAAFGGGSPESERWRGSIFPTVTAIARGSRGNGIPVDPWEWRKRTFENNRAAVQDPTEAEAGDRAAQHAPANGRAAIGKRQLQIDRRAGQEPVRCFDEDAAGRDVEHGGLVTGSDACSFDAVFCDRPSAL